jgi:hypothetical protein
MVYVLMPVDLGQFLLQNVGRGIPMPRERIGMRSLRSFAPETG